MHQDVESQHQVVRHSADVILSRKMGRTLAEELGFSRPDQALIATAISELARNIVNYAGTGRIEAHRIYSSSQVGIRVVAIDKGPGIPDIESALTDGFSTGDSLGLGLPGTRRIVDEFSIQSTPGEGVTISVVKWKLR